MQKIRFVVDKRQASLVDQKYSDLLKEAFAFSVPSARFMPSHKHWLAQKAAGIPEANRSGWNGKISMFKNNAISVGMLYGCHKELKEKGYDLRISDWQDRPKVFPKKGFIEKDQKYEYQNQCVTAMLRSIPKGGGLVLSATGTGKTKIAAQFFSRLPGKCLFVVDQIELLYQAQVEIQEWLKKKGFDSKVGVVGNSKFELERVTVATIQTLYKFKNTSPFLTWFQDIDAVLIDELHVQMSRRNFNVIDRIKAQAVIGLTATLEMNKDAVRFKCYSICGPKIFDFGIQEGVSGGVLTEGVVVQSFVPPNLAEKRIIKRKVKDKRTGELYTKKELATDYEHEVVYNPNLQAAVKDIVEQALHKDYAIVVLCERIRHLKRLRKRLKAYGPRLCYGAVDVHDRKKHLKSFDDGRSSLIIANRVFTKGINIKRVDLIIDTAQRKSRNDCKQKYGRGVRLHRDKDGLIYVGLFTEGFGEKAATSQRGAFKKARIPVQLVPSINPLKSAEIFLEDVLNKPKQRKLF